jgi:hypothetical protein
MKYRADHLSAGQGSRRVPYGPVDTGRHLVRSVDVLAEHEPRPNVVLSSGYLVDLGEPAEYVHLRSRSTESLFQSSWLLATMISAARCARHSRPTRISWGHIGLTKGRSAAQRRSAPQTTAACGRSSARPSRAEPRCLMGTFILLDILGWIALLLWGLHMAQSFAPWAFATSPSHHDRLGRTATPNRPRWIQQIAASR